MLLHVSHAAHCGHHELLIQTVDTDVVVLALYVAQCLAELIDRCVITCSEMIINASFDN